MRDKIKYIAAYRSQPESKVTHYAPVASIEPYGEEGKYKLIFAATGQADWANSVRRCSARSDARATLYDLAEAARGKEIDRAILRRFMMAALRRSWHPAL